MIRAFLNPVSKGAQCDILGYAFVACEHLTFSENQNQ